MATKIVTGADFGVAGSFSPSGVPTAGDVVYFDHDTPTITSNWDALAAVALGSVHFLHEWTGESDTYLEFGMTTVWIGEHFGTGTPSGSPNLKVKASGASTIHVLNTSTTSQSGYSPPVLVHLNDAAANLFVRKGAVGLGLNTPGETAQVEQVYPSYIDNVDGDATVIIGSGVTCGGIEQTGGLVRAYCPLTGVTVDGGKLTVDGTGTLGNVTVSKGLLVSNTTGTTSQLTLEENGAVNYLLNPADRTVNDIIYKGGQLMIGDHITVTNGVTLSGRLRAQAGRA